ncbi:MAG: tyrosine protein phosphatase [Planctomycetes bacterium]|nr:tyrosine protein phosphatase [Planctomycetota bacterium]
MRPEICWIDGVGRGRLGIAARPRGGDWLEDEAEAWRAAGVDCVVSALTSAEEVELGLQGEREACRRRGMGFVPCPIPDRGVPESAASLRQVLARVIEELRDDKTVLVHCRQGIGRASMIAACALAARGEDVESAFERIGRARGRPVPETDEQREWVRRFVQGQAIAGPPWDVGVGDARRRGRP